MTDRTTWTDIEQAASQIVERCDRAAGDDGGKFMRLMNRFVVWDDDEIRERPENWLTDLPKI